MNANRIKVVHQGRGGHVTLQGSNYEIEHANEGHFYIHFPSGNRHSRLQAHLDQLKEFASSQDPTWSVENHSKRYI
jgi:hypothetical protein